MQVLGNGAGTASSPDSRLGLQISQLFAWRKIFQIFLAKTLKFAKTRPLKKDNRESGQRILL
jgi:hypothetical protein